MIVYIGLKGDYKNRLNFWIVSTREVIDIKENARVVMNSHPKLILWII